MFVDGYAVDKLKIIAHAHGYCPGTAEQPVIETFSASKAVPATVICNAGHHNQIYVGDIDRIVAVGFLYVERAQMCARSLVGQDVEVRSVHSRQIVAFALGKGGQKLARRQFVGQGMVKKHAFGHYEGGHGTYGGENAQGRLAAVVVVEYGFTGSYALAENLFVHRLWLLSMPGSVRASPCWILSTASITTGSVLFTTSK